MELLTRFTEAIWFSFTSPEPDAIAARVIITVLILAIICAVCYYVFDFIVKNSYKDPRVAPANVAITKTSRESSLIPSHEGFADFSAQNSLYTGLINTLDSSEKYLVNLCPLTASIGGYIGPLVSGVFDPEFYVRQALRAGIRSFVLPISVYYDDTKREPQWPFSGKPAIVCRDSAGKILSLNGMSIKKFSSLLVMYMSQNMAQSDEPILLYLDATPNHIPNIINDEKGYVQFTSDIAAELAPLDEFRLITISSYGSAVGGVRQSEILTQIPLAEFKKKIIIFTNFDILVGTKEKYVSTIKPLLFDYTNFVYVPVTAANVGTSSTKNCFSIHLADTKGTQVNWTEQSRVSWIFSGQDDFTSLPDSTLVQTASTRGIQSIPIPLFFTDPSQTKPIWSQWNGYAWRVKPKDARYKKPPPIVPQNPSTALNARVDNTLQPGQTLIKA